MTAKAKTKATVKPRKTAKSGTGAKSTAQSKLARHQARFNGRIISLDDVGCGLSEVFANQMAFGAFARNWLKHADVDKVEIGDVIRIAEMNVSAMARNRRGNQATDITPPKKFTRIIDGNVVELTGVDRLMALVK